MRTLPEVAYYEREMKRGGFPSRYWRNVHPIDGVLHRLELRMPKVQKTTKATRGMARAAIALDPASAAERQPHEGKRPKPEGHHAAAKLQAE